MNDIPLKHYSHLPITYMENKLKINHFRELYKSLKTPFPPINFLILGMLIGLEQRWIDLKAKQTVDNAIEKYMVEHPDTVYEAVVEECEDGGYTIGYYPDKGAMPSSKDE